MGECRATTVLSSAIVVASGSARVKKLSFYCVCRRVRDKYESELKELEASEKNMQEKYNNMKVSARFRQ